MTTIADEIKAIVAQMGLAYIHETIYGANYELDKVLKNTQRRIEGKQFPACINILATNGRFDIEDGQYHELMREVQNVRILFVDQMKFDDKVDDADLEMVERLKGYARTFIAKMQKSGKFLNVPSWNWQLRLNAFDANVGVIEITAIVKQYEGDCMYD